MNLLVDLSSFEDDYEGAHPSVPEWDRPPLDWRVLLSLFRAFCVVMVAIVLLNLLIAIMTNTFERIRARSTGEWRLQFAWLVKVTYLVPTVYVV
jgi:hypothetical protein